MPTGVYDRTDSHRKIQRESHKDFLKGENHPNFGRRHMEEARLKISQAGKKRHHSEETKKKMSDAKRGHITTEETKRKISSSCNKKRSEINAKIRDALHRPDVHEKISAAKRGERNHWWKGGKSFEPYCPAFTNQLREDIRNAFGRKCFLCDVPENEKKLAVHHVDYNKGQGCGQRWSLVPLCNSCHNSTTHNRHYYFNLLANYWAINPGICFGLGDLSAHFIVIHPGKNAGTLARPRKTRARE